MKSGEDKFYIKIVEIDGIQTLKYPRVKQISVIPKSNLKYPLQFFLVGNVARMNEHPQVPQKTEHGLIF
jgi:hypothetical protein